MPERTFALRIFALVSTLTLTSCWPAGIATSIAEGTDSSSSGVADSSTPLTQFVQTPPAFDRNRTTTFKIRATEPLLKFTGSLDGGAEFDIAIDAGSDREATVSLPIGGGALTEGSHSFQVFATGRNNQVETRALGPKHEWTVDTIAPESPFNVDVTPVGADGVAVLWTDAEDEGGSGIASYKVTFQSLDAQGENPVDGTSSLGASPVVLPIGSIGQSGSLNSIQLSGLEICRLHTFEVTAIDRAGNEGVAETGTVARTGCGANGNFVEPPTAVPLAPGATPVFVTTADFNRDGIVDLLVVNTGDAAVPGSANLTILLGAGSARIGDGTFAAPGSSATVVLNTGGNPVAATVADVDEDGDLDVWAVNDMSPNAFLFLQTGVDANGTPTFTGPSVYAGSVAEPAAIAYGDLVAGGNRDLVIAGSNGTPAPGFPVFSILEDLNSDLVYVETITGLDTEGTDTDIGDLSAIALWDLGDETGLVATSTELGLASTIRLDAPFPDDFVPYSLIGATSVVTGDLNNDGLQDAVVGSFSIGDVGTLIGDASRRFSSPEFVLIDASPESMVLGDFDGDRILDLVTADNRDNPAGGPGRDPYGLTLLLGQGGNAVGTGELLPVDVYDAGGAPDPAHPRSVATADFNADLIPDLVVTNPAEDRLSILFGDGRTLRGSGTAFQSSGPTTSLFFPTDLAVRDFDSDGLLDVAVLHENGIERIGLWFGVGANGRPNGTFNERPALPTGGEPEALAVGDLNLDGIDDLVIYRDAVPNPGVAVWLGNGTHGVGDGTFATTPLTADVTLAPDSLVSLAVGPFGVALLGDDGFLEVVRFAGGILTPLPGILTGALVSASEIRSADLDRDGAFDLAVIGNDGANPELQVWLGQGDGTFVIPTAPQTVFDIPAAFDERTLELVDLDLDGVLDVVAGFGAGQGVLALLGSGSADTADWTLTQVGGLQATAPTSPPVDIDSLATGDFNRDGLPDIVATSETGDTNVWIAQIDANGRPTGQFGAATSMPGFATDVGTGDFNGDGIVDIVHTSTLGPYFDVLAGQPD